MKLKDDPDSYIMLYCVYLPPENSKYARENELALNHLTIDIYSHCRAENVIVCGDFNAGIGGKSDCQLFDQVQPRSVFDQMMNSQGGRFLSFINDICGCVVNRRINPDCNDYTSINCNKGKAVVDYFVVRQPDLDTVHNFMVKGCMDIITEKQVAHLVTENS